MPDLAISKDTLDEAIDRAEKAGLDLETKLQGVAQTIVAAVMGNLTSLMKNMEDMIHKEISRFDGATITATIVVKLK